MEVRPATIRNRLLSYFSDLSKSFDCMTTLLCCVGDNKIGPTGCQYISEALKTNNSVTSIALGKSHKSIECNMITLLCCLGRNR